LGYALADRHLAAFFLPFGLANRHLAGDRPAFANLLHASDRVLFPGRARHPGLDSLGARAGYLAALVGAGVTAILVEVLLVALAQARAAFDFLALVVALV